MTMTAVQNSWYVPNVFPFSFFYFPHSNVGHRPRRDLLFLWRQSSMSGFSDLIFTPPPPPPSSSLFLFVVDRFRLICNYVLILFNRWSSKRPQNRVSVSSTRKSTWYLLTWRSDNSTSSSESEFTYVPKTPYSFSSTTSFHQPVPQWDHYTMWVISRSIFKCFLFIFWTFFFIVLQDHREEDYFLYIAYSDENVYGQV